MKREAVGLSVAVALAGCSGSGVAIMLLLGPQYEADRGPVEAPQMGLVVGWLGGGLPTRYWWKLGPRRQGGARGDVVTQSPLP